MAGLRLSKECVVLCWAELEVLVLVPKDTAVVGAASVDEHSEKRSSCFVVVEGARASNATRQEQKER